MNVATRDWLLDVFGWIWKRGSSKWPPPRPVPVAAASFRPVDQWSPTTARGSRGGGPSRNWSASFAKGEAARAAASFSPGERINGYWDRSDTDIDLVALNATDPRLNMIG
jgi:hypothetical protein